MKTRKLLSNLCAAGIVICQFSGEFSLAQIPISGLIQENQGMALWNAGYTGAEPAATGHSIPWTNYDNMFYYGASIDYIRPTVPGEPNPPAGFQLTEGVTGFPLFVQALNDYGFTMQDVTVKIGLYSLGNDTEGDDWFIMGNNHYTNYYSLHYSFYLDEEPILACNTPYQIVYFPNGETTWNIETAYSGVYSFTINPSPAANAVSQAFIQDLKGRELRFNMQLFSSNQLINENGRRGVYYNIRGSLETGVPVIPVVGLLINKQGLAAWNTDGTGPEPKRTGHMLPDYTVFYYLSSRDYDNIDPDPMASMASVIGDEIDGFFNFNLQLAYRGFTTDQLRIVMGLSDLDEDVQNEDWNMNGGSGYTNYYHSWIKVMLNGEPLFGVVLDTLKSFVSLTDAIPTQNISSSMAYVYDASGNSTNAVKMVAKSFFRDLANKQMALNLVSSVASAGIINSNGRTGAFWQINGGQLMATKGPGTIISGGDLAGTLSLSEHPYYITGEITVPDGQTLTIEPGVWLKFSDRYRMQINGRILAEGTSENTGGVVFTAANPDRGWGHMVMDNIAETNGESRLTYCTFEKGYASVEPYQIGSGAVFIRNTNNVLIDHCIFQENEASVNISQRPNGGAIGLSNSSPQITSSVFSYNKARYGGAIDCDLNSSPMISRCVFNNNESTICGGALMINKLSNPSLINNTITQNSTDHMGGGLMVSDRSNPILINNILWGNIAPTGSQISVNTGNCTLNMSYCDLQYGTEGIGQYGIGNGTFVHSLTVDPLFIDHLANNFLLDTIRPSQCINAGSPYLPLDPDGSFSDIGAFQQTIASVTSSKPVEFNDIQFRPNPFKDRTQITFNLPENSQASVSFYNAVGSKVAVFESSRGQSGEFQVVWNATGLPDGIYFCRIECGGKEITRKIVKLQ